MGGIANPEPLIYLAWAENHCPDILTCLLLQFVRHPMTPPKPSSLPFQIMPHWNQNDLPKTDATRAELLLYTTSLAPQSLPGRVLKMAHRAVPNLAPDHPSSIFFSHSRPAPYAEHFPNTPGTTTPLSASSPHFPLSGRPSRHPTPTLPVEPGFKSIAPSCLAFSITRKPGGLPSIGSQRVRHG